jgi:phosphomannomutase
MLGVEVVKLYCEPNGHFPHNPEPLAKNLQDLSKRVIEEQADFGIAVDPDVDRLAIMDEQGRMFGEEYTLVSVADYVLSRKQGATVSNLSSSRALRDITEKHGAKYYASAVGEVNVVAKMKEVDAVIGGEGNGGVIYPNLHYGRDSLVGVALFLSLLAEKQIKVSELRQTYTSYFMAKEKIELTPDLDVDALLNSIQKKYKDEDITTIDGVKIDFSENWVHLRKSNTEPIVRIYTEAKSQNEANELAQRFIAELKELSAK